MTDHWVTGLFYEEKRETLGGAVKKQQEQAKAKANTGLAAIAQQIMA